MNKLLKKIIIKFLYETKALTFNTWKSPTHLEQYTEIRLFGSPIELIKWSELEQMKRLI